MVSRHIRRYLLEIGGEQCSRCGWSERHAITGRVPLEMDHLNGNYADNRLQNLRLLCPSCHALTPNFKALNKGKGRPYAIVRRAVEPAEGVEPPTSNLQNSRSGR
jgi:HNH endonuclease